MSMPRELKQGVFTGHQDPEAIARWQEHLLTLEARYWLSRGYSSKPRVDALMNGEPERDLRGIIHHRGKGAADRLLAKMREEFARQRRAA